MYSTIIASSYYICECFLVVTPSTRDSTQQSLSIAVSTSASDSAAVTPFTSNSTQQTTSTFVTDHTHIITASGGISLCRFDDNESALLWLSQLESWRNFHNHRPKNDGCCWREPGWCRTKVVPLPSSPDESRY